MGWRGGVYGVILGWLVLATAQAQELPIFDAHIHYSRPDWQVFTPERVLAILDRAGVQRALVSSTPDDGTLMLYEAAPQRVVPFLRPYRSRDDMASWHHKPLRADLKCRLTRLDQKHFGVRMSMQLRPDPRLRVHQDDRERNIAVIRADELVGVRLVW